MTGLTGIAIAIATVTIVPRHEAVLRRAKIKRKLWGIIS